MESKDKVKKMRIEDIAKELGLSNSTVSRAISGKGRISEKTRKLVLDYTGEKNFTPRKHLPSWTSKITGNICVTLPGEEEFAEIPYFQKILLSIYDYCIIHGYNVIVVKIEPNNITELKKIVWKHKIDGVILTRTMENDEAIQFLKEKGVPLVVIGSYADKEVIQVDVNHEEACRELTSILVHMGYEKFALLCGDMTQIATRNRLLGCKHAFEKNGIGMNSEKVSLYDNVVNSIVADKVVKEVIQKDVECLLCMDDNICFHVLKILHKNRISIPSQIKIASFYDSPLLEAYHLPITCVEYNIKELGIMAATLLLQVIKEEVVPKTTILGYKVSIKESTKHY